MDPSTHSYFDFYQSDLRIEPYAQPNVTTLDKVYSLDPVADVSVEAAARVLGIQFQLWPEFLTT